MSKKQIVILPGDGIGLIDQNGRRAALYELVHGSAPGIAGQGIANPLGTILSVAMMLRLSLGRPDDAALPERAVEAALAWCTHRRNLRAGQVPNLFARDGRCGAAGTGSPGVVRTAAARSSLDLDAPWSRTTLFD